MSNEVYHFEVGGFKCVALSDGTLTYATPAFPPPPSLLFYNAPNKSLEKVLLQHNIQPESWSEWVSPYICLLVNTGEHLVLVDTGADKIGPNTGRLVHNLQAAKIEPENIDMVILTHCHPDHIGGITSDEGKLVFTNARYAIWKDEWDFWTSEEAELKLDEHVREILMSIARKNLPPIQDRLDLIAQEKEILSGIRAIAVPGHTPGHMALDISAKGERLMVISDTVLHPIHIEQPEWCAAVDYAPDKVVASRCRIFNIAASDRALVLAFHFPFPGLGHIIRKGDGWEWQPIPTGP